MRVAMMVLGLLVAAPVVAPLGGCAVLMQDFEGARDKARNAAVRANVFTVVLGLEQYATDNSGTYPSNEGWFEALTNHLYLPDDQLPLNPFPRADGKRSHQPNGLTVAGTPLAPATAAPTPEGTVLGPGRLPDGKGYDARTFGAIIYDHDPASGAYVVYGIGKRGNDAVVTIAQNIVHDEETE